MLIALIKLMRLDKPIGIFLLWFPTAWALHLAYGHHIPPRLFFYFALGTILMRSAGCVINDIADRRWDAHVWRTQNRPLAKGTVSLFTAWGLLFFLLTLSLIILIQLPKNCFYVALIALTLTSIYPFCKRFMPTPQMMLSLAFTSSIPMVNRASQLPWNLSWWLLCFITIFWIIAYDTEYALADLEDDLKVGLQSSARFFGKYVCQIIIILQMILHCLWLVYAHTNHFTSVFYGLWSLAWLFWFHQWYLLTFQNKHIFLKAFRWNAWYGLWMWFSLCLSNGTHA